MDFTVFRRFAVDRNAQFFHHLAQLGINILPFAHPQIVQIIRTAQATELVRRQCFLLLAEVIPQIHKGKEIRFLVMEAAVFFVGSLLFIHWPLTRVLNRQGGGNNHRLAHASQPLRLQHHARQTRVHRQLRQLAAKRREFVHRRLFIGGNRAQLFQQTYTVLDIALVRRFNKREGGDVAQPQRGHLQNNRRQVGAQNLRIGKFRARQEIVFRIETDTDPFRDAAAAAFTLIGGGLGDGFNRQTLHFGAIAVAADTRLAGIDNVFNSRHRQRRFRDVGRQYDAPSGMRLENPVLFAVGQPRIQRQHFGVRQIEFIQAIGGVADFPLAAHKDQDIAGRFVAQLIHRVKNRL